MKRTAYVVFLLILSLFPSLAVANTPQVTSVSPIVAVAGTEVTLSGSGFGDSQGGGAVWLGNKYGVVVSWSDTQVVASVASGAKSGTAQILQGGVWSDSIGFTVITPQVTSVSPTSGVAGTQVTIAGTGFGATKGSGDIWLGNRSGVVVSWSDTQVVAIVASGAKAGTAQVLQGGVWSDPINFAVITPQVASVSPTSGTAATQVTTTGTGFGATKGSGDVWLGSKSGVVVSWSDTQVVATVASGAKSGTAQILQGGVWSDPINFTVITPQVTTVSPTSGVAGTQVAIAGAGFGATKGSGDIWLGNKSGVVVSWSDTQIVATVASGAKSGTAQVLQGGVWSDPVNFTVVTPQVSSVSPTSGVAGTQVTISGMGFGAAKGNGDIWLGNKSGMVVSWSDVQIVATVASGAKSGTAQVLQGGVWSDPLNFSVIIPQVTNVSPTTSTTGAQITIDGTGFGAAQANGDVWLGSKSGLVVSWNDTQIVATVASGSKTGTAQVLQGGVWSDPISFTLITPQVTSVTPTYATAGIDVTITGTGFGTSKGSGDVWLGSRSSVLVSWSDTQIVATVASGAKSGTAQVLQGGVWSDPITFTVVTPQVTNVSPSSGAVGTQVTITGTGFGATQGNGNVWLGSSYGVVVSWSDTQVIATVASGASSGTAQILQGGVWSDLVNFTVTVLNITAVSPNSGAVGAQVTITGTGFGASQGSGFVSLGSSNGLVTSWSDTQIIAIVAPGSTSGVVQVTQGGIASNSVSFTVATPTITSVSPTSGAAGTQATITGSGFGATQGSGKARLGTSYGLVVSWSDTQVVATIAGGSTTGEAQILQGGVASNSVPFTVETPIITSVTPTSGVAGTEVTVAGSGFGAAQGNGKVRLGSTYGAIVSWSDTQLVATVSPGSMSGTVQVFQGGAASNSMDFTVITPTITSVTPTSGAVGTQVTITGTDFGATQGSGNVWLGSANGAVVSWSDTQIVATVVAGSASGTAQVLQNGVWSNSVSFTTSTPQITSVTPNSGTPGTQVTITGSGFGATQGTGKMWLGSTDGAVVSWSDAEVIATVATDAKTGIARIQQAGVWSNAVRFVIPTYGSGNTVTLVPDFISMLVGETRSIQALNASGAAIQGLTWTSSDETVASLSTDDPPIIAALAAGHATITAGDASADLTVYPGFALPAGTLIWSAAGDGSGVVQTIPAVPSPSGVDVFALQSSGNVLAMRTDGTVAWTANVGTGSAPLADFQGGLVVPTGASIKKLDGLSGQATSEYFYSSGPNSGIAIHTDGTIFTVDGDSLVGIDPSTGSAKFRIAMEHSIHSSSSPCAPGSEGYDVPPSIGQLIIAGDGYAYLTYMYAISSYTNNAFCGSSTFTASYHFNVLRVDSGGNYQTIPISNSSESQSFTSLSNGHVATASESGPKPYGFGTVLTNADAGVVLAWSSQSGGYCSFEQFVMPMEIYVTSGCAPLIMESRFLTISGGSVSSDTVLQSDFAPALQAQDGTYFGTVVSNGQVAAFDQSGAVKWTVPNFYPVMATSDGGLIAQSYSGQFVTFDQNGRATGQVAILPTFSWTGQGYAAPSGAATVSAVALPRIGLAGSFAALSGGNHSGNGTAIQQVLTNQAQEDVEQPPANDAPTNSDYKSNYNSIELQTPLSADYIFSTYVQTFAGVRENSRNTVASVPEDTNITAVGQKLTFTLLTIARVGQGPFSVRAKAFDATEHIISVVTLKGHPLLGRRYWRVFAPGQGRVVVETGAIDKPAPGRKNHVGYYVAHYQQTQVWADYLIYIVKDSHAQVNRSSVYDLLYGTWGYEKYYIWTFLCHASACN